MTPNNSSNNRLLSEAEIKLEFRRHYKEVGRVGLLQIVYELTRSAELALEVLCEETETNKKKN